MTKSLANATEIDLGLEKRSIGDGRGRRTQEIGYHDPETNIEREALKETGIESTTGARVRTGMATDIHGEMQTTNDHGEMAIKTAAPMMIPETAGDSKAPTAGGHEEMRLRELESSRITNKVL